MCGAGQGVLLRTLWPSQLLPPRTCGSFLLARSSEEKNSGVARQISCINPGSRRVTDVVRDHTQPQCTRIPANGGSYTMGNNAVLSWEEAEVGLDIAGSGGRALASLVGPSHEGESRPGKGQPAGREDLRKVTG